jgi:uncharacterized protein YecE (DUF72 family)
MGAVFSVGTSGWQYASWRDAFYPAGIPARRWLSHYVTTFPVVELNVTFYRLPKPETFDLWRTATPEGFEFVAKASRYLTHIKRLRDPAESLELFRSRVERLGSKLGPVLFQFPPTFRLDLPLLEDFLPLIPLSMRAAFEFRDASWSTDEVFAVLDRHGAAWVLADRPGWRVPLVVTGGWTYVRFHQGQAHHPKYSRAKLRAWAERLAGLDVTDGWVFFNNDPLAAAPADALAFMDLLEDRGARVKRPTWASEG